MRKVPLHPPTPMADTHFPKLSAWTPLDYDTCPKFICNVFELVIWNTLLNMTSNKILDSPTTRDIFVVFNKIKLDVDNKHYERKKR